MGTPWQPDTTGAIVFLWKTSTKSPTASTACSPPWPWAASSTTPPASSSAAAATAASKEILRDRFGTLPIPAISGLSFGHIEQKLVLLIGARATLDADAGTVRVEEGRWGRGGRYRVLISTGIPHRVATNEVSDVLCRA